MLVIGKQQNFQLSSFIDSNINRRQKVKKVETKERRSEITTPQESMSVLPSHNGLKAYSRYHQLLLIGII